MTALTRTLALTGIPIIFFGFQQSQELPENWFKAGNETDSYCVRSDNTVFKSGQKSVLIQSIDQDIEGFATVMQSCNADEYLGTRVRMTGYIKAENVADWSGMWLRVDSKSMEESLCFDNMQDRPVKGTADWTKCVIELDVPAESGILNFGALLSGTGKIWFDNVSFEIVDTLTKEVKRDFKSDYIASRPVNLDFEY